jgi:chromosome segregation ATPase
MKRLALLAVVGVVLSLSGCMSTGFMGFLATTDMVDKKISDQDKKISDRDEKVSQELDSIKSELKTYQSLKDDARKALDQVTATQKDVEELKVLLQQAEGRLNEMPRETIQKLVEALQQFLGQQQEQGQTSQPQ